MAEYRVLGVGDPAPWFTQRSTSNPNYHFNTAAGRYIVLCFFGTSSDVGGRAMLQILKEHRELFEDRKISFFGIGIDPADQESDRVAESMPGIRHIWDFDLTVSRMYGAAPIASAGANVGFRRFWLVLDPALRIRHAFPAQPEASERDQVVACLRALPPIDLHTGIKTQAPVILLNDVFEPELCTRLVDLYNAHGGEESGFMREVNGKTVQVNDFGHKRRADHTIADEELRQVLQHRIRRRVVPEIKKVHQFDVTRMERYIVACYDSDNGGHFGAHRDNTTKGTAHRRFAVSINLNRDFEGGEVSFPEYGSQSYKPAPGGAVVFSCSLLHAVSPMKRGKRYAFLPFLYDDTAAAIREANNAFLGEQVGAYTKSV
jgi:peroxiredoxin/predicted 2-oxoglutarate/Fe(II)-dependent dioxygenase YbiX